MYEPLFEQINNPDASVGVCCSHKVVTVGFNTLCYDAERRGIKPSVRIKSVPIILFFITVATLFAGERNLQQRAVYHLKISSAEQFTINVYFQHKKENIHANRDLYKIDQATRDRELKTQGVGRVLAQNVNVFTHNEFDVD